MTSMEMTDFLDGVGILQCALGLAVPVVLGAVVNLGCGKKREEGRPAGAKPTPGKSSKAAAPGVSSKSKRSTKSLSKSSKKSVKDKSSKKSKRSTKDKSGKSSKKSKKSGKSSKELRTGAAPKNPASVVVQSTQQASSAADKNNSVKTAKSFTGLKAPGSERSITKQPGSGAAACGANNNSARGESTHDLKMEPTELRWSSAGGMQKISLLNQSAERQAVKVKCSDNNVYRVNPVYAYVEPGQTLSIDVMRQTASNKVDKIVFVTAKAGGSTEGNPKNFFKTGPSTAMMVLPLLATDSAGPGLAPAAKELALIA